LSKVKETLQADLKKAMIEKDNFKRDTIRFLMAALKQIEVDERRVLSDDDIYTIIQKSIKQRNDAAAQYKDANRADLYEKEEAEAEVLEAYLPAQLSDDELKDMIKGAISKLNASSMKDMGAVMGVVKNEAGSSADGKRVSSLVKELLK
jgi:uncharacterized protein YqeY